MTVLEPKYDLYKQKFYIYSIGFWIVSYFNYNYTFIGCKALTGANNSFETLFDIFINKLLDKAAILFLVKFIIIVFYTVKYPSFEVKTWGNSYYSVLEIVIFLAVVLSTVLPIF